MRRKLTYGAMIGFAAWLVAAVLWHAGALDDLEHSSWGWRVKFFASRTEPDPRIKVILLDQYSLDWGNAENGWSWPWPRTVYTAILDFCKRGGARAVAFDVIYTEPSVYEVSDDEALASAIQRSVPFVGAVVLGSGSGQHLSWPAGIPESGAAIEGLEAWLTSTRGEDIIMPKAVFPIPQVATNAAILANVSDEPDRDGIFRRASLFRVFDGRAVLCTGLAAYLAAEKQVSLSISRGVLKIGNARMPMDDAGRAILYFRGKTGAHETYTAASVIQSEQRLQAGGTPVVDPAVFKDCYVFLGFSAPGLLDLRPTPLSRVFPGVEIHAAILDNLLSSQTLQDAEPFAVMLVALVLALAAGIGVVMTRKAWQCVAAFMVLLPLAILPGYAGYAAGYWWPIAVVFLAVMIALVAGVVANYATEGRQKRFIKQAFRHYLGAEVIEQLIADPSRLQLGGEKRELTILFSDIEKFSSFSENLDPHVLIALLNEYLTEMGAIITEEGGYLDKFIGDAVVAFWNAPMAQPDHAARAVRAALRCQKRLAELRGGLQQKYGVTVKMRIGVNTGEVTVGNMGSRERFNYTVLGDAANLASRLEGANKVFGGELMVSESTWAQAGGWFAGRELGRLRVVGRKATVTVFQPYEAEPSFLKEFQRALEWCYAGKYSDALAVFDRMPDDPAARAYADRIRKTLSEPAPQWDGIWNLTEK
ncbi:MAG: CHASE2 domain-containing protein [Kiritimatiellia bacterium]